MTDLELLYRVLSVFEPRPFPLSGLHRGGRLLLCIPRESGAARMALGLYQPQRTAARCITGALKMIAGTGMHAWILPRLPVPESMTPVVPALTGIMEGSCGVLLGSPEHKVRRAIACYKMNDNWEVAKISIGSEGKANLHHEARTLEEIHRLADGVPRSLGLHSGEDLTILRMPYLAGEEVKPEQHSGAVRLLASWIRDAPPRRASEFGEWNAIATGLKTAGANESLTRRLADTPLRTVICHGDFARWNLREREDGGIVALDWEWGRHDGMPGIDLVHYFMQDMRLVRRMSHSNAIDATIARLRLPECADYLSTTGWRHNPIGPVIACLAYKQGTGQQESLDILKEACRMAT